MPLTKAEEKEPEANYSVIIGGQEFRWLFIEKEWSIQRERIWSLGNVSKYSDDRITDSELIKILGYFGLTVEDCSLDLMRTISAYELERRREARYGRKERNYELVGRQTYDSYDGFPVSDHYHNAKAFSIREAIEKVTPSLSKKGEHTLIDGEVTACDEEIWLVREM